MSGYSLASDTTTRTRRHLFDEEQLQDARALLRRHPAVSLHDHPIRLPDPITPESWQSWRADGSEPFGFAGLRESGLSLMFASSNSWHSREEIWEWAASHRAAIEAEAGFYAPASVAEIQERHCAAPEGGIASALPPVGVLFGLETMSAFDRYPEDLERLVQAGFRMAGFSYDPGNALGGGLGQHHDGGVTPLGREMLTEMNRVGMIIDLAHAGDTTSAQVIELSELPVVISHAGSRTVWPTQRMKPDDLLLALRDHGGLIGIEAAPNSTISLSHPTHTLSSTLDHLDYLLELVGPDHIAFGPDTMFGDHTGIHRARSGGSDDVYEPGIPAVQPEGYREVDYVDGLENPRENFLHLVAGMRLRGLDEPLISKAIGGNALRVLQAHLEAESTQRGDDW